MKSRLSAGLFATIKHLLLMLAYGLTGVVLALLIVLVMHLNGRPDLSAWHTVHLDEEYTEDSEVSSFGEYLGLEQRLFGQLQEEVLAVTPQVSEEPDSEKLAGEKPARDKLAGDNLISGNQINRYSQGSLSDPQRWPKDWNRSYELTQPSPRASVLLLHGLSDSPYSLQHMAEKLHQQGAHVLNLRLPGHGTAPSGLVWASWQDMAAAVRLAIHHLHQQNPDVPLHLVGYSNGAALALLYELASLTDPALPKVDRLVLISPEIGVSRMARFAKTQARLGRLLGLEKLAWNDILPEYDPFKYGSFAINAGNLSYEITREIRKQITALSRTGEINNIAPILAFSSVVDATVEVTALVGHLFNRLPVGAHELVLFDINRSSGIEQLMQWNSQDLVDALKQHPQRSYTLHLLTNLNTQSRQLELRTWSHAAQMPSAQTLPLAWPDDIYSLTHVALPFPPTDPLYGGQPESASPGIQLGTLALRGERGVLQISAAQMLRLRWNPFYSWLEDRTLEFLGLN
jgi:alpha-beta hydrolase superfamily lysophospholipase